MLSFPVPYSYLSCKRMPKGVHELLPLSEEVFLESAITMESAPNYPALELSQSFLMKLRSILQVSLQGGLWGTANPQSIHSFNISFHVSPTGWIFGLLSFHKDPVLLSTCSSAPSTTYHPLLCIGIIGSSGQILPCCLQLFCTVPRIIKP